MNTQLVILGHHRSGTSALAQHCQSAGLFLGHELLGAKASNPLGHFEDRAFFEINEAIFQSNLFSWDTPRDVVPIVHPEIRRAAFEKIAQRDSENAIWGFKDPRSCMLLDFWHAMLSNPKYLICLRHYSACIDSILRRHVLDFYAIPDLPQRQSLTRAPFNADIACANWCVYMSNLLSFLESRDVDALVVQIDALPPDASVAADLNARFNLMLEPIPLNQTFRPELFQKKKITGLNLDPTLEENAAALWARLQAHIPHHQPDRLPL